MDSRAVRSGVTSSEPRPAGGRETRLLLATIVVSVGVLLLLARFRFPEASEPQPADPAPAPLERLAARAPYEELASTIAELERRIAPSVAILRVQPARVSGGYVVAPRVATDRAVALVTATETIAATEAVPATLVARDIARELIVVGVPPAKDAVVTPRSGTPRAAPRYVVVVEGTAQGPTLRPVYVGRTSALQEPRTGTPLIGLTALEQPIPRGAAVFSLEGTFLGLASDSGSATSLIAGDFLQGMALAAQPSDQPIGDLGIEVQPLTPPLARASGAEAGVMVTYVQAPGPAEGSLRPGDVIQSVDDTAITTVQGFSQVEHTRTPGAEVKISILRDRAPQVVGLRAGDVARGALPSANDHGIVGRVAPGAGVDVVAVRSGSPAARAGIQRGDLIVFIGSRQAPGTNDIARDFQKLAPGDTVLVGIYRGQQHQIVALEKR